MYFMEKTTFDLSNSSIYYSLTKDSRGNFNSPTVSSTIRIFQPFHTATLSIFQSLSFSSHVQSDREAIFLYIPRKYVFINMDMRILTFAVGLPLGRYYNNKNITDYHLMPQNWVFLFLKRQLLINHQDLEILYLLK